MVVKIGKTMQSSAQRYIASSGGLVLVISHKELEALKTDNSAIILDSDYHGHLLKVSEDSGIKDKDFITASNVKASVLKEIDTLKEQIRVLEKKAQEI